YAGIDLHGKRSYITIIDPKGGIFSRGEVVNQAEEILGFLGRSPEPLEVVMESTGSFYWLHDLLVGNAFRVVVSDPGRTKAIASAKVKNDKVDSHLLAQLLRAGLVAEVYVSGPEIRALKELLRHRAALIRNAVQLKVRIRSLLAKNNIQGPLGDLFSRAGRRFLAGVELPDHHQRPLENYMFLHDQLRAVIDPLEREIKKMATGDERARLLMTLPGVGVVVALTILAEVGEISRFKGHRQLASYAGLIPSSRSSAGVVRHGRMSKRGSTWLRDALIEAAHTVARLKGRRLNVYFRRQAVKKGYKMAVVATARRLLTFAYYVLRDGRPYQEESALATT
ncbi:MAG: IS110 family transposase, partial [Deltaproteobacteria bacterium]|nr:IS110 family transposase [Deltaproteobacteria bacterium]